MVVVLRGVRMFSGLRTEEGGERPLREVTRLCGLSLGGYDLLEFREDLRRSQRQPAKKVQHLRVATFLGQLVHIDQGHVGGAGGHQLDVVLDDQSGCGG